jgi:hypothetical protein
VAKSKTRVPPRWFVVAAWHVHRWMVRVTGGRKGLWPPRPEKWGALRLTTRGRRSGEPRSVIIGYYEEGPNLVAIAMNGWGANEPAWWLNLQALWGKETRSRRISGGFARIARVGRIQRGPNLLVHTVRAARSNRVRQHR